MPTGSYFKQSHIGLVADLSYLGLGMADRCTELQNGGDATLTAACHALDNQTTPSAVITFQVGALVRPFTATYLLPYVEGLVGLANTPTSSAEMVASYVALGDQNSMSIYRDYQWTAIRPTGTLAIGVTTAASQGIQFRLELRESFFTQSEVTSANPYQDQQAIYRSALKGFPTVLAGFDIVFRKDRGKRY